VVLRGAGVHGKRSAGPGTRRGYATVALAEGVRRALLSLPSAAATGRACAVGRWLEQWLSIMDGQVRPSTMRGYREHVRHYLAPLLGGIRLASLRTGQVQAAQLPVLAVVPAAGSATTNRYQRTVPSALKQNSCPSAAARMVRNH
jgi:hypothetical protein